VQAVEVRALIRIGIAVALIALAIGALAATGVASPLAKGKRPEKVKVEDDFYNPTNVKVKKNGKVTWKWGQVFNNHNVTLKKGPKGVNKSKFTSQTTGGSQAEGFKFTKKFKKPGKYNFYCTIHPDIMKMIVKVKG
jgi:plastocyanin